MQNYNKSFSQKQAPDMAMSVQYLKGVGPRMAEKLSKLDIRTLEDLLYHVPRAWEDRRLYGPISDAKEGTVMTLSGAIRSVHFTQTPGGFAIVEAGIEDGSGRILLKWIRKMSYRYDVLKKFRNDLEEGRTLLAHGKISSDFSSGKTLEVDDYEVLNGSLEDSIHFGRIVPVYGTTNGLNPKLLRQWTSLALNSVKIPELLPSLVIQAQGLLPLDQAVRRMHFPENMEEKDSARIRLAFQELFLIQLVLALSRQRKKSVRRRRYVIKKDLLTPFREKCGFEFTHSQKKVINEIFSDLTSEKPMNRLLQGDVGSGKTVVAICSMLLACENGFQSVLLSPTEILAEQHYYTLKHFLGSLPVKVGLLTGSVLGKKRQEFLKNCGDGSLNIAVGTHALLEKEVRFKNLGLAVIDEQQRFGVRHRFALTRLQSPDVLVMTATPIPRTLALGLYGDLDTSTIDELPPGRQKIESVCLKEKEAYDFVRREAGKGRQAYIVFPLVDESDKTELKAAVKEFDKLKNETFKNLNVGLLHGQMKAAEKESVMEEFYEGKHSVLITTTVIEVGIDAPSATVMVIQHAERFGLSTLHQLRGRIARRREPGRCILVAQPKTEEAKQRIDLFLKTRNGFEIAEADLKLRGPGEIFGTSQHGLPPLKIADWVRDYPLILKARDSARDWLEQNPDLNSPGNRLLRDELRKRFSKNWFWSKVA